MRCGLLWMTIIAVFGLTTTSFSQDKKVEEQKIVSKGERVQPGRFLDFSGELGLDLAILANLGERIDRARLAADPIELALAATLLQAAESAAGGGKKTSLSSAMLLDEAVTLAKRRGNPSELSTIAKLAPGKSADELAALAKTLAQKKPEPGEVTQDLHGDLIVDNHSHSELHIYVNGYEIGHAPPHNVRSFHVHDVRYAEARDHFGHRWVANFQYGHYHRFVWLIQDPHHPH